MSAFASDNLCACGEIRTDAGTPRPLSPTFLDLTANPNSQIIPGEGREWPVYTPHLSVASDRSWRWRSAKCAGLLHVVPQDYWVGFGSRCTPGGPYDFTFEMLMGDQTAPAVAGPNLTDNLVETICSNTERFPAGHLLLGTIPDVLDGHGGYLSVDVYFNIEITALLGRYSRQAQNTALPDNDLVFWAGAKAILTPKYYIDGAEVTGFPSSASSGNSLDPVQSYTSIYDPGASNYGTAGVTVVALTDTEPAAFAVVTLDEHVDGDINNTSFGLLLPSELRIEVTTLHNRRNDI